MTASRVPCASSLLCEYKKESEVLFVRRAIDRKYPCIFRSSMRDFDSSSLAAELSHVYLTLLLKVFYSNRS